MKRGLGREPPLPLYDPLFLPEITDLLQEGLEERALLTGQGGLEAGHQFGRPSLTVPTSLERIQNFAISNPCGTMSDFTNILAGSTTYPHTTLD